MLGRILLRVVVTGHADVVDLNATGAKVRTRPPSMINAVLCLRASEGAVR